MTIAILGYGREGKAVEKYFKNKNKDFKIFENFTDDELRNFDLSPYEMVFRSPGVKPFNKTWNSSTKYFLEHCKCPIIGVTGTKGKGTTCSLITAILKNLNEQVFLVGNIGKPAIEILDDIQPNDVVVYEMSSFQLWDLNASPKYAVILRIEPDHLNMHGSFENYIESKSHIAEFQTKNDFCIYFNHNKNSEQIAQKSAGTKIPYPIEQKSNLLKNLLNSLNIPGDHNKENAEAALLTVSTYFNLPIETFIEKNEQKLIETFRTFEGLPHRCQFLRELNNVKYYDDNFSTTIPSLEVALKSFKNKNIILILGGRDKTNGENFPIISKMIDNNKNISKVILLGESGHDIFKQFHHDNFILTESLKEAVETAKIEAEKIRNSIVLMSPAAASFDMFKDVYDRGSQYQTLIKSLK